MDGERLQEFIKGLSRTRKDTGGTRVSKFFGRKLGSR